MFSSLAVSLIDFIFTSDDWLPHMGFPSLNNYGPDSLYCEAWSPLADGMKRGSWTPDLTVGYTSGSMLEMHSMEPQSLNWAQKYCSFDGTKRVPISEEWLQSNDHTQTQPQGYSTITNKKALGHPQMIIQHRYPTTGQKC